MEKRLKYRIYPSLLDKYQSLLDYEQETDVPWNVWTEKKVADFMSKQQEENANLQTTDSVPEVGDYILSADQMYEKIEKELIASINREEHEPSEAASKGTALNEVIDCLILNQPCQREDMTIESLRTEDGTPYAIRALLDDFSFTFDLGLCKQLRDLLKGSVCQYFISAEIETKYGLVQLYGYLDYWLHDKVIDLKTTGQYNFGKYERKWQRHVYPYCCIESGQTDAVHDFTYLAVQLGKGAIIKGTMYPEEYTYNHKQSTDMLRQHLESFIEWLERNRALITDKKIFNELED